MKVERLEFPENEHGCRIDLRVKVGDRLQPGDILALLETGKATQELEAFEPMRIVRITELPRGYAIEFEPPDAS